MPSIETLERFEAALGVPLYELFKNVKRGADAPFDQPPHPGRTW
jgi:hypothetical protein